MSPNTPTRRDVLKQTGIASAALLGGVGTAAADDTNGQCDGTFYITQQAYDYYGWDPVNTVMGGLANALGDIGIEVDLVGGTQFEVPSGVDTVGELHDEFDSWVSGRSDKSEDTNHLIALDQYECRDINGVCAGYWDAFTGDTATSVGAGEIAVQYEGSMDPDRYGTSEGDKWLNVALQAIGHNIGGAGNTGEVYSSSYGDYTRTPLAEENEDQNICEDSILNTDTFDSYDHYYADCAASYIEDYFA